MKVTLGLLAALLAAGPSISYFKYQRPLPAAGSSGQHYAILDETFWQHARPDLDDLRLYAGGKEVPYQLAVERGGMETERKQFRVLQPATVGGKTQFLLDMSGVPEYDRIELKLATRNFVARARIEGQDDPHGQLWAVLGTTTLYDLSDEKLGHNSTLQIPVSAFKYLRVTMDNAVKPADVQSGTAGITRSQKAVWRDLRNETRQAQQGKDTVFTFSLPENLPVERITFELDPAQQNFRRGIEVRDGSDLPVAYGEIYRIHMERNGQRIDAEQYSLNLGGRSRGTLKAIIHNADDAPLKITGARLAQYERRIYFDADAGVQPSLYYGDEKLEAPIYDYAKLFQRDKNADALAWGLEQANTAYTGRPDERPWSERHPAVLWAAIVAAVALLGGIALRSLKTAST